jgi:uncharacterized protein (DUF488 family)
MPDIPRGAIYTFGYGGSPLETLLRLVERYDISAVVDVRRSAVCRWSSDWGRESLSERVPGYLHLPSLGNSHVAAPGEWVPDNSAKACGALSVVVLSVAVNGIRILLLCAEADPAKCHRSIIAQQLTDLTGIPHQHLTARDSEPEKQLTLTPGE